ncbi:MAG: ubiquinol-cytochrome c reductase iron-sulfur subunit [gamma proteobacterium symbiont of Bathyaustriella thionipta]|nr:ubiquinol-cytochrome c reductase iron-sulfur subunit [gamma proteobacterium symbiont of Bathyaustriella thionipta]MCU7948413.1 ubiquinol-cytochrome c reductase iron-sulfur subunit [gamma proteobacterium symbiont of Bathyaustriella thionipta]MCU7954112.1 ubiquinol-cytochrome c reductase iron-sulfur subunit [gamma proteobacterium symbiont of Bathyaustriella thionipta]MCU7955405.1 ubiquinol-cytochrome c reductase iron-sulfur subunit [gamma proteobacterium symbiont of Bathyaustriella thionipta]M
MSADAVNNSKRRFLVASTSVVGAIGAGFVAVPFVKSWNPSTKALAAGAPVLADISKLEEGQMITVEWRGKPVYILKRTDDNLNVLESDVDMLADVNSDASKQPEYCKNSARAYDKHKKISVMEGVCTHLGCAPKYLPDLNNPFSGSLGSDWKGGFFCPCHGSIYDLSGRVYKSMPAPTNLPIPPHMFKSETVILIGQDGSNA